MDDRAGRAALSLYGKEAFFDMRVSEKMNDVKYVYFAWIVLDANDQVVTVSEAVLITENDELYEFSFWATLDMANVSPEFVKLAFGDDKVNKKSVTKILPECRKIIDYFHLCCGNKGICILSKVFGNDVWKTLKPFMQDAALAETEEKFLVSRLRYLRQDLTIS